MTSDALVTGLEGRTRVDTAFTGPLRDAVARVPGARGAVFLDGEGEAIDEFADVPTTEIRILGAHLGILVALWREHAPKLGEPQEVIIETERALFVVLALGDRYIIALETSPDAPLGIVRRELGRAAERIRAEMA